MTDSPRLPRRRLLWLGVLLGGVALAAAASWYAFIRDTAAPVSVSEAVVSFRTQTAGAETAAGVVDQPAPGVYVYETKGFERVDAFLGSRHDYPPETTMTVSRGDCGLVLRWDALAARSTVWYLCPAADRWLLRESDEVHRFFGRTEHTDYRCEPGAVWWPVGAAPGASWTRRCTSDQSTKVSAGTIVGRETVRVAGEEVDAVHLHLDVTLRGNTRGTGTFDVWLAAATGLVLRLESTDDDHSQTVIGDVHYEERVTLSLTSLEPRR